MHVLIAKGEPAGQSRDRVIVSKQELLGLLKDLNICVYNIMDEYEMTQQSHDEAERKSRRKGEKIVRRRKNGGRCLCGICNVYK